MPRGIGHSNPCPDGEPGTALNFHQACPGLHEAKLLIEAGWNGKAAANCAVRSSIWKKLSSKLMQPKALTSRHERHRGQPPWLWIEELEPGRVIQTFFRGP